MLGAHRSLEPAAKEMLARPQPGCASFASTLVRSACGCHILLPLLMPKITALLHTHNDALRLGRALDSLRACDEILVIDDSSDDDTLRLAREHGAAVKTAIPGVTPGTYAMDAAHDWVFCILPNEALSETLEAALLEWKEKDPEEHVSCLRVQIREEVATGWQVRDPEVRLANRRVVNWFGETPPDQRCATLAGELLRFCEP